MLLGSDDRHIRAVQRVKVPQQQLDRRTARRHQAEDIEHGAVQQRLVGGVADGLGAVVVVEHQPAEHWGQRLARLREEGVGAKDERRQLRRPLVDEAVLVDNVGDDQVTVSADALREDLVREHSIAW